MKLVLCLSMALGLAGCGHVPLDPESAEPGTVWAIIGVSVVPMDREGVLEDQTVVVSGGRITALGAAGEVELPKTAEVIDGAGRFLMPGLWDLHVHLAREEALPLYLAKGVTTVAHLGGDEDALARRAELAAGEIMGPRLLTCGPMLFGDRIALEEVAGRVRAIAEAGYDCVKIYNEWEEEAYKLASDTAADIGILFMGHAPRNLPFDVVLEDGRQRIVHLEELVYTTELDQWLDRWRAGEEITPEDDPRLALAQEVRALARRVVERGIWVIATEIVIDNYLDRSSEEGRRRLAERPYMKYVHPLTRRVWLEEDLTARHARFRQQVALQHLMLEIFLEEGVKMAAGTDASLPEGLQVVPGWSLHEELGILRSAGATPFQALQQATVNAAAFMRREGEGVIVEGARADLLLLSGNPLEDLAWAAEPVAVVTAGSWIPRSTLETALAEVVATNEARELEASALDGYWDQGAAALAAAYRDLQSPSEEMATFLEQRINRVGYTLLAAEDYEGAIEAFTANVETFPESANCYDSLAEGYLTMGDRENAILWYRKALEVDPGFANAAAMLRQIGIEP